MLRLKVRRLMLIWLKMAIMPKSLKIRNLYLFPDNNVEEIKKLMLNGETVHVQRFMYSIKRVLNIALTYLPPKPD